MILRLQTLDSWNAFRQLASQCWPIPDMVVVTSRTPSEDPCGDCAGSDEARLCRVESSESYKLRGTSAEICLKPRVFDIKSYTFPTSIGDGLKQARMTDVSG